MIEFFFEVLLQLVFEILELVFTTGIEKRERSPRSPLFTAILYIVFGVVAGFASLWIFPQAFINSSVGRIINLILTPVLMGTLAAVFAAWRTGDGLRLWRFVNAYVFALSLALVRFVSVGHCMTCVQ
ncbi:hypothetical protein UNDYM_1692 [Undibacterium sp. YM2]|uniref:hypothetical protein n=1 Tax=Undibacterium sp. YM2 TaxID=2058625 RepID=UPI001331DF3A|nr:hypothetical protein [Undibacterium sp. YM2]BBB65945.1 hypothetical protein UNDYM_1692 [Undibacterium sp. YM2]